MNRQSGAPLEGRAVLAYRDYRLDEIVVYASTQTPHTVRVGAGRCPRSRFAPAARRRPRCRRRVRPEGAALPGGNHPRRAGARARSPGALGRGPRRAFADLGAYPRPPLQGHRLCRPRRGGFSGSTPRSSSTPAPMGCGRKGPTRKRRWRRATCPARTRSRTTGRGAATVATNKAPIGPYRGVGRPGACFAIERTIDEVARAVGRDPIEVRALNMVRPDQMPFTTVGGMRFDNGDYPQSVRLCAELRRPAGDPRAPAAGRARRQAGRHRLCRPLPSRPRMVRPSLSAAAPRSCRASRAAPRASSPTARWC